MHIVKQCSYCVITFLNWKEHQKIDSKPLIYTFFIHIAFLLLKYIYLSDHNVRFPGIQRTKYVKTYVSYVLRT